MVGQSREGDTCHSLAPFPKITLSEVTGDFRPFKYMDHFMPLSLLEP